MPSRLWMAAFMLALAAMPLGARAETPSVENNVTLSLELSGLSGGDCQIEIKPGHAGCTFPPIVRKYRVESDAIIRPETVVPVEPITILARSINPDRECAFAITVTEPGKPPKTYRRGLRLAAKVEGEPVPAKELTCYLSSPSMIARDDKDTSPRR